MKDSPDPPPPIDPVATARAQGRMNIDTANANARLNRTNQSTPWGNITWQQGAPDENGVPSYSSQITLPPELQRLLEMQREQNLQRQGMAGQFLGQVDTAPLDFGRLNPVYDRYADNRQWTGPVIPRPQGSQGQQGPQGQQSLNTPPMGPMNPLRRGDSVTQESSGPMAESNQMRALADALRGESATAESGPSPGLTYRDYLAYANYGQISGEGSPNPISETQWNAMPPQEQWSLVGGRVAVTPDDPRYAELKPRVGGEDGRNIWISETRPPENGLLSDAQLVSDDGWFAHSEDNETPQWQAENDISDTALRNFLIAATLMAGGAAASGAFSGAAGAAAGEGALAGAAGESALASGTAGVGNVLGAGTVGGTIAPAAGVTGGSAALGGGWQAMLRNPQVMRSLLNLLSQPRKR